MRIKFLNKNNNQWYEIDEGSVHTSVKNETLDSATIVISNQMASLDIDAFDVVELQYGNEASYIMCVDTVSEVMIGVNPRVYKYEIHLFSETKLLEGIVLPNLKITKMPGITRSIYYYINQYLTEYCPQIRVDSYEPYEFKPKWTWNTQEMMDKFSDECPEMQWNTPTLREVLNDLMMVKDCIPVLRNSVLGFMDLTEVTTKDWENDERINFVTKSRSSEDYVSELQVKLENVTNNDSDIDNLVNHCEYYPLSCQSDDDGVMTTNNMIIKTQYPIYRLKSLKIIFPGKQKVSFEGQDRTETLWIERDLFDLIENVGAPASPTYNFIHFSIVYEYQEWLLKTINYQGQYPSRFHEWANYRNFTLYYKRGGNEIYNLNNLWSFAFLSKALYEGLCENILLNDDRYASNEWIREATIPQWYNLFFKIEYETLEGCVFRASKGEAKEHDRVIIDNQTNSYVDSYNQGFLEYQKANRLGNQQLQINARFSPTDRIIQIGDTYGDSIVYQVQYQRYADHVEVNALATKNYILRDYFTGVKSKIRSWAVVKGNEALTRHDLIKYYCEFSWREHEERYGLENIERIDIVEYLLTPLTNYDAKPINYCFVRTTDGTNYYPAPSQHFESIQNSYYALDVMKRIVGNSMVLTFEFSDNVWAGKQIDIEPDDIYFATEGLPRIKNDNLIEIITGIFQGTTGVPIQPYVYTDSNGENVGGEVIYLDDFRTGPTGFDIKDGAGISSITTPSELYLLFSKPRVWTDNIPPHTQTITTDFTYRKDSQEITNISTQFEFCSDTNNICFSKEWLRRQRAMNTRDNDVEFNLVAYNAKLNFRRPDEFPALNLRVINRIATVSINRLTNLTAEIVIKVSGFATSREAEQFFYNNRNLAWYLNIESDNGGAYLAGREPILIGFTGIPTDKIDYEEVSGSFNAIISINLNILKSRNKNIYDANNHYLISYHI